MKLSNKNLIFVTIISSLVLLTLIVIKEQNYSANKQTLASTDYKPQSQPVLKSRELSCSDCLADGKDTICFNVEVNRATCSNVNNNSQNINVLCRKCSRLIPKPTVFITPVERRDKCYYTQRSNEKSPTLVCPSITLKPSCIPLPQCKFNNPPCIVEQPAGGWCPIQSKPIEPTQISQ